VSHRRSGAKTKGREGGRHRPRNGGEKKLIEQAYQAGEKLGLSVWNEDEAGPFQTKPYPGENWQPEGYPVQHSHEYVRNGTAKLLTLFHPASGQVRVEGVTSSCNAVLHPWLKAELTKILETLPEGSVLDPEANRDFWLAWQKSLIKPLPLPEELPQLRMLLIWDNLQGHHSTEIVTWLVEHGILPLYTPLGGSWLNMAESIQRILIRRGLAGQQPETPAEIIANLEAVARGWNHEPTPFVWGGKRALRRQRSRQRKLALGGSGACTRRPIRSQRTLVQKWQSSCQMTH
jgi:transposase